MVGFLGEFFQVKEEGGLARMTLFCRLNCKTPYSEGDGVGQGRGLSRNYSFLVSSIQCEEYAGCSLSTHVIYYMVVVLLWFKPNDGLVTYPSSWPFTTKIHKERLVWTRDQRRTAVSFINRNRSGNRNCTATATGLTASTVQNISVLAATWTTI